MRFVPKFKSNVRIATVKVEVDKFFSYIFYFTLILYLIYIFDLLKVARSEVTNFKPGQTVLYLVLMMVHVGFKFVMRVHVSRRVLPVADLKLSVKPVIAIKSVRGSSYLR